MLKKFEAELLKDDWNTIRDGYRSETVCPTTVMAAMRPDSKTMLPRQGDIHPMPQPRSIEEGRGDGAASRAEDRRAAGRNDRSLPETETRSDEGGTRDRPTARSEYTSRQAVRRDRQESRKRATLVSSGRKSKRLATGPHSAPAATFFAPTSPTGATKSCGKRTFN